MLAAKLGIAPSSVTEMVKKLAAAGLVSHVPYGAVRLTDTGTARALAMVRRHRLIETWLVQEFDYGWDEVHDEAEVLEHTISDRLLEGIDARLGRPASIRTATRSPTPTVASSAYRSCCSPTRRSGTRDRCCGSTTATPSCSEPSKHSDWRSRRP